MKRYFAPLTLSLLFLLNACATAPSVVAQQNEVQGTPKKEDVSQEAPNTELIISNLNQIQFSLSKIMATRNKAVLEAELSDVLNHIDPQSLGNDELISAYEYLLNTLVNLKMTQSERDALAIEIQNRRANVKWEAVSNIGNAIIAAGTHLAKAAGETAIAVETGGATAPAATKDYGAALTPLANMAVFTLLNIKKLHGEITTDSVIRSMALDDAELEAIDHERINLFVASARALKDAPKSGSVSLIQENEMRAFGELVTMLDDPSNVGYVLNILENEGYKHKFKNFAPYQHALIKAYFIKKDSSSYNNKMKGFYESIKASPDIYNKQHPYARESARYMAIMAIQYSDAASLKKYINDLREAIPQIPEEKINFHFFAFPIYAALGQMDDAKNSLEFLKNVGELTRESRWNYQYYCKLTKIGDNEFCKNAESVWADIDSLTIDKIDSNSIQYGCFLREAGVKDSIDYQVLENPYEYEIKRENVGVINKTVNAAKKGLTSVKSTVKNVVNFVDDVLDKEENKCLDALESKDSINAYNKNNGILQIRTIVTIKKSQYTLKAHKYGDRINDKDKTGSKGELVIDELKYKF